MSSSDLVVACEVVDYTGLQRPEELVAPRHLHDVFTERERRQCAARSSLDGWAGRLAAKQAVARVLDRLGEGQPLAAIEVLSTDRGAPEVLGPGPAIGVTVSHERGMALSLAWRSLPDDEPISR